MEWLEFWDIKILDFLVYIRSDILTKYFLWITDFADQQVVFVLAALFLLVFYMRRQRPYLIWLFTTMVGSVASFYFLKILVGRPRPNILPLLSLSDMSFPSGHATLAVALFGFIAIYIRHKYQHRNPRLIKFVRLCILLLIISICVSRVYLGVHYPTDVIAGVGLGLLWLWIGKRVKGKI